MSAQSKQSLLSLEFIHLHGFSFIFIGFAVSGLMLHLKAKEFSTDPAFKASLGWYQNWKRRHSVSLRAKTTLAQRLPEDMEEKIVQFHRFIIAARQRAGYPLSRIYNMDETPMRFKLPSTCFAGVHWQPNSSGKNLRSRKTELHCHTCRRYGWNKTPIQGHF